jgi:hypothetical protein
MAMLVRIVGVKVATLSNSILSLSSAFILSFVNLNGHGDVFCKIIRPICFEEFVLNFFLQASVV